MTDRCQRVEYLGIDYESNRNRREGTSKEDGSISLYSYSYENKKRGSLPAGQAGIWRLMSCLWAFYLVVESLLIMLLILGVYNIRWQIGVL
jgi:hypothetical protein